MPSSEWPAGMVKLGQVNTYMALYKYEQTPKISPSGPYFEGQNGLVRGHVVRSIPKRPKMPQILASRAYLRVYLFPSLNQLGDLLHDALALIPPRSAGKATSPHGTNPVPGLPGHLAKHDSVWGPSDALLVGSTP